MASSPDKCAFLRSYLRSSHFNMISPHPSPNTQTPKYQTHRFDIHVFLLRGESRAINANIRLARCFIVMLPSALIDRNGCPIHIMHSRGPSQMAPVLEPLPIYLLFENRGRGAAKGLNAADGYLSVQRWLSKYANTFW